MRILFIIGIPSLSTMNCNSRRLFSFLGVFPVFRFPPFDFLCRFDWFYNCANQSLDTWFCQLIDSCARVPVFSHRIAHAPFKLHVAAIWVWDSRNLSKKNKISPINTQSNFTCSIKMQELGPVSSMFKLQQLEITTAISASQRSISK